MAGNQCIIDEAYCAAMAQYYQRMGMRLDKMVDEYIAVLSVVRDTGIVAGDVHAVLDVYVAQAAKMKNVFVEISESAQYQVNRFLERVDEVDQYLF